MIRRPPRSTRTDTLFPYTTLFRSGIVFSPGKTHDLLPQPTVTTVSDVNLYSGTSRFVGAGPLRMRAAVSRSEEHTSELQSLMRISYAVFCLKKKNNRYIMYKST